MYDSFRGILFVRIGLASDILLSCLNSDMEVALNKIGTSTS